MGLDRRDPPRPQRMTRPRTAGPQASRLPGSSRRGGFESTQGGVGTAVGSSIAALTLPQRSVAVTSSRMRSAVITRTPAELTETPSRALRGPRDRQGAATRRSSTGSPQPTATSTERSMHPSRAGDLVAREHQQRAERGKRIAAVARAALDDERAGVGRRASRRAGGRRTRRRRHQPREGERRDDVVDLNELHRGGGVAAVVAGGERAAEREPVGAGAVETLLGEGDPRRRVAGVGGSHLRRGRNRVAGRARVGRHAVEPRRDRIVEDQGRSAPRHIAAAIPSLEREPESRLHTARLSARARRQPPAVARPAGPVGRCRWRLRESRWGRRRSRRRRRRRHRCPRSSPRR